MLLYNKNMHKKVLICTPLYPPDIGGPATYSKLLKDELPKHGFGVDVLSFGSVRKLPRFVRHFVYFLKVLKIGHKFDIIFAQDPVSVGLPSLFAAKVLRKKFILKIVGDYAWEQGIQRFGVEDLLDNFIDKKYGWRVESLRRIQKFTANSADKIIVPSFYLKNIVSRWGVKEDKIKVVYNAFKPSKTSISREEARQKLGLNGVILVSAGRLVPWKGFGVLVKIMSDLLKKIPDLKLLIIGDGPRREVLKLQITNHKLQKNVFLVGEVPREKVLMYLCAGDLFVLNTGYEGLSHQLLEAMAVGIPIVTTDLGGNPELIKNKESGLLVEYNNKEELKNAIMDLYKNEEKRTKFVASAQQRAREFTKEKMINELVKILK